MDSRRNLFDKTRIQTMIWASKLLLLIMGAISTATLLKLAVIPCFLDLFLSTVPKIWLSFKTISVSPLYIYLVVNFIIAAIVVSSAFNPKNHSLKAHNTTINDDKNRNNSWESFRILRDDSSPPEGDFDEEETPPDSSSGGESSLEETWNAIMAAKRGLKRPEDGEDEAKAEAAEEKEMRKSETFGDRVSFRREKPMSPEELSRRADAFIKKVNNDMRLQRLVSEQRSMEFN